MWIQNYIISGTKDTNIRAPIFNDVWKVPTTSGGSQIIIDIQEALNIERYDPKTESKHVIINKVCKVSWRIVYKLATNRHQECSNGYLCHKNSNPGVTSLPRVSLNLITWAFLRYVSYVTLNCWQHVTHAFPISWIPLSRTAEALIFPETSLKGGQEITTF